MAQKKGKKPLASYYGDPKKVTRGDIITAAKMKANKNGKKKKGRNFEHIIRFICDFPRSKIIQPGKEAKEC